MESLKEPNIRTLSTQAINTLREMRDCGQLCDAILKCESGSFQIHRAILSACSPYFRALFTNSPKDLNASKIPEYYIPGIDAESLGNITEFAYTRSCSLTGDNVQKLLAAADQFNVMGMVRECCDFIGDRISIYNCFGVLNIARTYFCKDLEKRAWKFIMKNFIELWSVNEEYLNLDVNEMNQFIGADNLNVRNEEMAFNAVLKWINHDPENRKQYIAKLLPTVRLGLLDANFFVEKIKAHPFVKDNDECKQLIIETLKFLYDLGMNAEAEENEKERVVLESPLAKPRIPHEILFAVGGWSGGSPTNLIEAYDTRADRWVKVTTNGEIGPRAYHGCVVLDQLVYIIGGFDGMEYFNSVRIFDPVSKSFREAAPMNSRRCYVSAVVLGGFIYAMGGFDGHTRLNTTERFNPKTNQWSLIAPMHLQRSDASATVLDGKIYITGGFNGQECLSSAEAYDPETELWTMVAPMRNRRSGVSCTTYHGQVYVLGGFNGISRMCSGEKYNPVTDTWSAIPDMYTPRSNFAVEVIDDMVFVIGGFNGVTTIYQVECYEESNNEWYEATDMGIYRSALAACVVDGLPNVRDFIHKNRDKLVEEKLKLTRQQAGQQTRQVQ